MDVLIAGAGGKIGRLLVSALVSDGHVARGLVRRPEQADELEALGATPVLADLEADDALNATGADAVVFTAGAGPGSGAERKETVDFAAAVKLADAAQRAGARRYLMVSAMGAADPEAGPEAMQPYLSAKARADAYVAASGLDFTIVRPGSLTDEPATQRVAAAASLGTRGSIPRADVALTLLVCLSQPRTIGTTFELLSGETPIAEALRTL